MSSLFKSARPPKPKATTSSARPAKEDYRSPEQRTADMMLEMDHEERLKTDPEWCSRFQESIKEHGVGQEPNCPVPANLPKDAFADQGTYIQCFDKMITYLEKFVEMNTWVSLEDQRRYTRFVRRVEGLQATQGRNSRPFLRRIFSFDGKKFEHDKLWDDMVKLKRKWDIARRTRGSYFREAMLYEKRMQERLIKDNKTLNEELSGDGTPIIRTEMVEASTSEDEPFATPFVDEEGLEPEEAAEEKTPSLPLGFSLPWDDGERKDEEDMLKFEDEAEWMKAADEKFEQVADEELCRLFTSQAAMQSKTSWHTAYEIIPVD